MKLIDLDLKKAKKGMASPRAIALDLLEAIENGEIKNVVYIVQTQDDMVYTAWNDNLLNSQAIGLLTIAQIDIHDHMKGH